ncbi:bifunctional protein HldE isoform X2 [Rhodamnia argentea]|uniref:Bifunctional protein HldE isoform X2 n=1 Tax=Rhodamnia argentea TaxID=178133 RepID=A0ABM3HE27_9MYRT|nr:bifunctional protein HldE isoform X2 [Rhodamnia argentea]
MAVESRAQGRIQSLYRHLSTHASDASSLLHPVSMTVLRTEQLSRRDGREAVIIGGMVLDIHALPLSPPAPGTTIPGKVHYVLGGVARNIADCMSKLGGKPFFISAVGLDMAGNHLLEHWRSIGRPIEVAARDNIPLWFEPVSVAKSKRIVPLVKYVTYVSPNEDELFAMADALSPGKLYGLSERYNSEKNCPPESLIKMLKPAVILLLEKGIKIVVVTIGARGAFLCSKEGSILTRAVVEKPQTLGISSELHRLISSNCPSHKFHDARHIEGTSRLFALHLPGLPASVKKLTGAGDCLVGATLASICEGLNIIQAISVGIAAAKATVEADSNVPLTFDLIGVADDARSVYSAAKVVYDGPV